MGKSQTNEHCGTALYEFRTKNIAWKVLLCIMFRLTVVIMNIYQDKLYSRIIHMFWMVLIDDALKNLYVNLFHRSREL